MPSISGAKQLNILSLCGLVLVIAGEIIRKASMFTAKTNFNHYVQYVKQQGHELVTTGVYSFCRHPSYVGWFLWSIGTQVGNERNFYEPHHEKTNNVVNEQV